MSTRIRYRAPSPVLTIFVMAAILLTASSLAIPTSAATQAQAQGDIERLTGLTGQQFEVQWLSMMIEHHEGAIDMSQLAADRASHQEVKTIAQNIIRDQDREVAEMTSWLKQWYNTEPVANMMHDDMHGMAVMLQNLKGDEFDKAFLQLMTQHHQGAIVMAALVPSRATHAELMTLAQKITTAQQAEIQQFKGWARTWYNLELTDNAMMAGGTMMGGGISGMMGGTPGMPRTGEPISSGQIAVVALVAMALVSLGAFLFNWLRPPR
jgi:uncharacterized protein (DUF305 family)